MPYTHELEMLMINKNVSFLPLSEETRQIIKEKLIKMGKSNIMSKPSWTQERKMLSSSYREMSMGCT